MALIYLWMLLIGILITWFTIWLLVKHPGRVARTVLFSAGVVALIVSAVFLLDTGITTGEGLPQAVLFAIASVPLFAAGSWVKHRR